MKYAVMLAVLDYLGGLIGLRMLTNELDEVEWPTWLLDLALSFHNTIGSLPPDLILWLFIGIT